MKLKKCIFAAVIVFAGLCYFACSSDPPNSPGNGPKDYVVYGFSSNRCIGYHTLTGAVDTLAVPFVDVFDMKSAPDGRRIYFQRGTGVSILDVSSRQLVADLPFGPSWDIAISPDGSLLAFMTDSVMILRTSDFAVMYQDNAETIAGAFSHDGKHFYYRLRTEATPPARCSVSCVDVQNLQPKWRRGVRGRLSRIAFVSMDNERLICYPPFFATPGVLSVYDIDRDSVVFDTTIGYTGGEVVQTPDGRQAFLTVIGNFDHPHESYTAAVFDIVNNKILDSMRISSLGSDVCPKMDCVAGGDMTMTPDGILYVTESWWGREQLKGFVVYNALRPDTAKFLCTGRVMSLLTCQTLR